jgi:hypothetical protein
MRLTLVLACSMAAQPAQGAEPAQDATPAAAAAPPAPSADPVAPSATYPAPQPAPVSTAEAPAAYPAPGPPPLPFPPPPVAPPQYARRSVELIPHLGVALPHCQAGDTSSARCSGVSGGLDLGFSALWRMSPYFAAGGTLHLVPLRNEPSDPALRDADAFAGFLGLVGRVYFLDDGRLEPYIQLGLGGALLGTAARVEAVDGTSQEWTETGAGPALQVGAGLDFILTRGLRLGPSVTYTRAFVDKIRRCPVDDDAACADVSKESDGYLDAFLTFGARLTILVGQEL